MCNTIKIIGKDQQSTSEWSGGTTTELAIYPEGASYRDRSFMWRLSSATVDLEESVFTSLPGIWRYIMVIEGEMDIEHEGHHKIHLKPYQQDSFNGGWVTRSRGRVRDFNLMLADGCSGKIEAVLAAEDVKINRLSSADNTGSYTEALYCTEGGFKVLLNDNTCEYIYKGDLIIIDCENGSEENDIKIVNVNNKSSILIRSTIYK